MPHKPWTSRNEFGSIAGELASATDRAFERAILPYARAIWPNAQQSSPRGIIDRAGIDIYVGQPPNFEIAIQCKGFFERELVDDQISQSKKSLAAFQRSRYTAKAFYFLHNRHRETRMYRDEIDPLLKALVPAKATKATLWNHRDLLLEAFDAMFQRVRRAIALKTSRLRDEQALAEAVLGGEPLKEVPIAVSELKISALGLRSESPIKTTTSDPLNAIFSSDRRRIGVLIGLAGFGKTTTAMRMLRERSDFCVVIPAARIRGDIANAHTLFEAALDREDVLIEADDEDRPAWSRMIGPVLKYMSQSEKKELTLIIDALDESDALAKSYGLQRFFSFFARVKSPVIITMRTGFWASRRGDFDISLSLASERESTVQTLRVVELREWDEAQIIDAAERYRVGVTDASAAQRIDRFTSQVRTGHYETLYGDIPRRPLFLKFILDLLQEEDVEAIDRVALVTHWVRRKVLRDVAAPIRAGGARMPLRHDIATADDTVELAFDTMRVAALEMVTVTDGVLSLLPSCTFSAIRQAMGSAAPDGATTLMLHSLLVPIEGRQADGTQYMRFAHRLFQEYFLASALITNPGIKGVLQVPDVVSKWMRRFVTASGTRTR